MFAKLIKTTSSYFLEETDSPTLFNIAFFLGSEVMGEAYQFRDFTYDSKQTGQEGNAFSLDKENNNIIIDVIWHDPEEDHEDRVIMSQNEFLKMLDQWEKVYFQRPDEIIITQDDAGKIFITGKFADGREI